MKTGFSTAAQNSSYHIVLILHDIGVLVFREVVLEQYLVCFLIIMNWTENLNTENHVDVCPLSCMISIYVKHH